MKKFAFTLAEVLITLTIIGVIAVLTIPNLMKKWEDQHTVSAVKEAQSLLGNAIAMEVAENGNINEWDWPQKTNSNYSENAQFAGELLAKRLKVVKTCFDNRQGHCTIYYMKNLQGVSQTGGYWMNNYYYNVIVLKNGMTVSIFPTNTTSTNDWIQALTLRVDINGTKGPNREGYDIFYFDYQNNGTFNKFLYKQHCNAMQTYSIADNYNAHSCVIWILKHGNVDYKYRDVSAEW